MEFQICESRKNNTKTAVNVVVKFLGRNSSHSALAAAASVTSANVEKYYGFVATLKDNFGFIEMADHDKEIFFHFR